MSKRDFNTSAPVPQRNPTRVESSVTQYDDISSRRREATDEAAGELRSGRHSINNISGEAEKQAQLTTTSATNKRAHASPLSRSPAKAYLTVRQLLEQIECEQHSVHLTLSRNPSEPQVDLLDNADVSHENTSRLITQEAQMHVGSAASSSVCSSSSSAMAYAKHRTTVHALRRVHWIAQWTQNLLEAYPLIDDSDAEPANPSTSNKSRSSGCDNNTNVHGDSQAAVLCAGEDSQRAPAEPNADVAEVKEKTDELRSTAVPTDGASERVTGNAAVCCSAATPDALLKHRKEGVAPAQEQQIVPAAHTSVDISVDHDGGGSCGGTWESTTALTENAKGITSASISSQGADVAASQHPFLQQQQQQQQPHSSVDDHQQGSERRSTQQHCDDAGDGDNTVLASSTIDDASQEADQRPLERRLSYLNDSVDQSSLPPHLLLGARHHADRLSCVAANLVHYMAQPATTSLDHPTTNTAESAPADAASPIATHADPTDIPNNNNNGRTKISSVMKRSSFSASSTPFSSPPPPVIPRDRHPLCCDVGAIHNVPRTRVEQRAALLAQGGACVRCGVVLEVPELGFCERWWCTQALTSTCGKLLCSSSVCDAFISCCCCCRGGDDRSSGALQSADAVGGRGVDDDDDGGGDESDDGASLISTSVRERQSLLPQHEHRSTHRSRFHRNEEVEEAMNSNNNNNGAAGLSSLLLSRQMRSNAPRRAAHTHATHNAHRHTLPSTSNTAPPEQQRGRGSSRGDAFPLPAPVLQQWAHADVLGASFCAFEGHYLCTRCYTTSPHPTAAQQQQQQEQHHYNAGQRLVEPEEWQPRVAATFYSSSSGRVADGQLGGRAGGPDGETSPVRQAVTQVADRFNQWWMTRHVVEQTPPPSRDHPRRTVGATAHPRDDPPHPSPSTSAFPSAVLRRYYCVLPAPVLLQWEFTRYPVSAAAAARLHTLSVGSATARAASVSSSSLPLLYDIAAINVALYARVPALADALRLRKQLCLLHAQAWWCARYRAEVWGIDREQQQQQRFAEREGGGRAMTSASRVPSRLTKDEVFTSDWKAECAGKAERRGTIVEEGGSTPSSQTDNTLNRFRATQHATDQSRTQNSRRDDHVADPSCAADSNDVQGNRKTVLEDKENGEGDAGRPPATPPPPRCSPRRRYLVERAEGWSLQDLIRLHTTRTTHTHTASSSLSFSSSSASCRGMHTSAKRTDVSSAAAVVQGGNSNHREGYHGGRSRAQDDAARREVNASEVPLLLLELEGILAVMRDHVCRCSFCQLQCGGAVRLSD